MSCVITVGPIIYETHLSRQLNSWSLRCSMNLAKTAARRDENVLGFGACYIRYFTVCLAMFLWKHFPHYWTSVTGIHWAPGTAVAKSKGPVMPWFNYIFVTGPQNLLKKKPSRVASELRRFNAHVTPQQRHSERFEGGGMGYIMSFPGGKITAAYRDHTVSICVKMLNPPLI